MDQSSLQTGVRGEGVGKQGTWTGTGKLRSEMSWSSPPLLESCTLDLHPLYLGLAWGGGRHPARKLLSVWGQPGQILQI